MSRETSKVVEIQGRKFEIKKFDAFTGGYIIFQLFEKFMPMGLENKIPIQNSSLNEMLPQGRTSMTKVEFISFVKDCLSAVGEVLPARTAPIINPNGTWGILDIQNNTLLTMLLVINVLVFNVSDFFSEDGLKELKQAMQSISLVNLKI